MNEGKERVAGAGPEGFDCLVPASEISASASPAALDQPRKIPHPITPPLFPAHPHLQHVTPAFDSRKCSIRCSRTFCGTPQLIGSQGGGKVDTCGKPRWVDVCIDEVALISEAGACAGALAGAAGAATGWGLGRRLGR